MKKIFCLNLIMVCLILGFTLSASATILPPNSRAITGKTTKIYKDKGKRNFMIRVQNREQSLVLQVPENDPEKLMARIKEYRGKLITIIYSYPDMTIINITKQERKKVKKF